MNALRRSIVMLAVSLPATAAGPQQFATVWPIGIDARAPALRLQLPTEVYAELTDPGLRDLMVFNASGEPVPFGPIDMPPSAASTPPAGVPATWFELPSLRSTDAVAGLRLLVERDADGRLRRLDAELPDAAPTAGQSWLLDLSARDAPIDRVSLAWPADGARSMRISVAASDDLARWRTVIDGAPLLDLRRDGLRLLKNEIELPPTFADYLLLTRTDDGPPLTLGAIEVGHSEAAVETDDSLVWLTLDPRPDTERREAWRYTLPGPLPVAMLDVVLASDNSVARIEFASRAAADQPWRVRAARTVFQLQDAGQTVSAGPATIGPLRDREWRLVADPVLDRPPLLRVGYRPDAFVMLARGEPPFVLAAGSATTQRPDYPIDSLLDALRERRGADWQPADASLGARRVAAGEPARRAPLPWQRLLLWGLLVGAALLLVTMVLRLLRNS